MPIWRGRSRGTSRKWSTGLSLAIIKNKTMIKQLILTAAVAFSGVAAVMAEPVKYGNRDVYGFFLSNGAFTNASENQYGFSHFTFDEPGRNELLQEMKDNKGVYAATAVDGLFYAIPYQFESSLSMPEPLPVLTYNVYTGVSEELGNWNPEKTQFKPQDLSYDIANDRLLAVGFDPEKGSGIYTVDRKTGAFTHLVSIPVTGGTIACDAHGRVFVISIDGCLYQVDTTADNRAEMLYQLPFKGLSSNQTMEFDRTCNKLYWAAVCSETPYMPGTRDRYDNSETWLLEISLPEIGPDQKYTASSGVYSCNVVGTVGSKARFMGLYIPYCPGGFGAPGFATDILTESSKDGSSLKISFNAPTKCFNGEDATTVNGFDIYREGVKIHTGKGISAGARVSFTDTTVPASGYYRYDIVCYSNTGGDGPKTPVYAYVGYDRPAPVDECEIDVSADFRTIYLSWTQPTEGALGGTFDPDETSYDITRLPDNVVVAKDIKVTSIEDKNVRRLLKYHYCITARNKMGESSSYTPEIVAGPPVSELPLEETFENPTAFFNRWTSVDNNGDSFSWLYGTDLGHAVFGDYEMTAEYIVSPSFDTSTIQDADDWIISPPVAFEDGDDYKVTFEIRSLSNERFNIYLGDKPQVEGMEKVGTFTLKEPVYADNGQMLFQEYEMALPGVAGKTKCLGVQLATPLNGLYYSYVQLGSITVSNGTTGIDYVLSPDGQLYFIREGSNVTINGDFSSAALYSVNGVKVMDISNATFSIDTLASGLYILVVDGHSFKIVK